MALGPEKAYGLARLAEATPAPDTGPELAEREIAIGGKKKRGRDASTRELAQAAREARASGRAPSPATPEERESRAAARRAQAALRRGGAKHATVEAKRAGKGWQLHAELEVTAAAILEAVWPRA